MFYTILIALFCGAFAFLSWKKPEIVLAMTALFLPSYQIRFDLWFVPMTLLEAMILILFLTWIGKAIYFKQKIIWGEYKWIALVWILIGLVSVFVSPNLTRALGIWKAYFVEAVMVYLLILNLVKKEKDLNRILNALFFSAFFMSLWAIIQRFTGWLVPHQYWFLGEGKRVTGFFGVPNFLSLYLGPIMGLLLGKIFYSKRPWDKLKIFYVVTFVLSLIAIVLAKSEGAIVAVLASLVFPGLIYKPTRILTAVLMLSGVAMYFGSPKINQLVLSRLHPDQNWSVFIRTQIWSESWQMLKDHWFFGAGLAGYQTAIIPYHTADYFEIFLYPHTILMNFWSEMGLLGLILFMIFMVKIFVDSFKLKIKDYKNELVMGVILAMVIFLVHGLVDHPYFKNDLAVIFWIIVGVLAYVKLTWKETQSKITKKI